MKTIFLKTISKTLKVTALLMLNSYAFAQITMNSMTADPEATSVTQVPAGDNIGGSAVIQFKFTDDAALINMTGQIPVGAVRVTITFPLTSAYSSVNSIPKFFLESFDDQPNGTVTLVNNAIIEEREVIDLLLNVRGTAMGSGIITFSVSRTSPHTAANIETNNDDASASFNTLTVLPVNLQSFDASINNCVSKINWHSNSEDNIKNYSLEYSNDGTKYSSFYEVNAKGNNSAYSTEHKAAEGNVFYRLKSVDFDGSFEYSKIITLTNSCGKTTVFVYPNPASEILNINISGQPSEITQARLYDATGKEVVYQNLKNGINQLKISGRAKGTYTLQLNTAGTVENIQVLIK